MLSKKPGPELISEFFGEIDQIPPEFRAKIGIRRTDQENPVDEEPDALVDEIVQSQVVQTRTDERKKSTFELIGDLDTELEDEVFIKETCQIGHRTRSLVPEGTELPNPDCLIWAADQHNLGNGLLDQSVTTVDELFQEFQYRRERPVVTPQDFRAKLQEFEQAATVCGTGEAPPAFEDGDGLIFQEVHQLDECKYRASQRVIDQLELPQQIVNYETNQFKQQVSVVRTLEEDTETPTPPAALWDVTFTKLGDGTAVEEVKAVDEVFEHLISTTEIPDLIPDIFKALLETHEREFTVENDLVDDPPTLATAQFYRSEEQIDAFNKRVRTRGREGISLPRPIVIARRLGGLDFGGETMKLTGHLDSSEQSVEEGLGVLTSEVHNLGNGLFFRQTEKFDIATEWPELLGTEVDPRTGIVINLRKKVVDAGTTGGIEMDGSYTDIKPLDKWRSVYINSKLDPDSLPDEKVWETTIEHRFPNELLGAAWIWAAASAPFAYDFDMALVLDMKEGYAGPCRAKITESFSNGPPDDVISPTIFCPQGHMLGYAWAFAADPGEDCGSCIGIARANARTWTIPPSLHDEISISGGVTLVNGTFTDTLPATTPIGLPTPGTLITKACEVEEWRFGVFYRRLVEIYVPDCDS